MKYYSEITKRLYDEETQLTAAEKDALAAEAERQKKLQEKKERAKKMQEEKEGRLKEVRAAYDLAENARKEADDLYEKYKKDYGATLTTSGTSWMDEILDSFNQFILNL